MAMRLTEIYTREVSLAHFKFLSTKKPPDLKKMSVTDEDSMMDLDSDLKLDLDYSFVDQYFLLDDPSVCPPASPVDCPSTSIFDTPSEPCAAGFIPKTELSAIATGSPAEVESCTAKVKRRASQSIDTSRAKGVPESEGKEKRGRASNWSNDEKEAFLLLKMEAIASSEKKSWFRFVSEQLWRRHEFDRKDKSCQQQWDLLHKAFKAIENFHDWKSRSGEPPVSFWDMDEGTRMAMKKMGNEDFKYLPAVFPKKWYDLMEKIIMLQAQVKKIFDTKGNLFVEVNREPSTSACVIEGANAWVGASDSLTLISPKQALVNRNALGHDCLEQQPHDSLLLDDELESRVALLVDKQTEGAVVYEQKYRENLQAMQDEHTQRLQALEAGHSQRLLAIEAQHSQRLLAIETEHSQRLQVMEAELLRRVDEVEQKHRQSLLDMLEEEELAASLKLSTIKERKRDLA